MALSLAMSPAAAPDWTCWKDPGPGISRSATSGAVDGLCCLHLLYLLSAQWGCALVSEGMPCTGAFSAPGLYLPMEFFSVLVDACGLWLAEHRR